jgi:hypothetical protein
VAAAVLAVSQLARVVGEEALDLPAERTGLAQVLPARSQRWYGFTFWSILFRHRCYLRLLPTRAL